MGIPEEEQAHLLLLRQRAEEALQGKQVEVGGLTSADIQYLLHELQVHQAELSIQNEELRRVQEELEISRDQYADLYNFAPVGYCTLNRRDRILEANQTLAELLEVDQRRLINQSLTNFVFRDDREKYYIFRTRVFEGHQLQPIEVRLVKPSGEKIYFRLETMLSQENKDRLLLMLIDVNKQRELQHRLIEQRENERQRIAHDLHDGPIQVLSAINFTLRGLLMDQPNAELTKTLEGIQANLREQIQTLRSYSTDLRPPILSHLGLEMAMRSYIEGFGAKHPHITIRLMLHPVGRLLAEAPSLALFRICQEAFQNIAKHTLNSVSQVSVRLDKDEHQVHLEIRDNGDGFDLPDDWFILAEGGHLGLIGMRERAEAVGGQLEISAARDRGTTVKASVPL